MTGFNLPPIIDLGHSTLHLTSEGMADAYGTDGVLTTHGFPTQARVQQMHPSVWRQLQGPAIQVLRSVSVHGLCATHRSGKLAGHRDVLTGHATQTLSRRISRPGVQKHPSRRQRETPLAHLSTPTSLKFSSARLGSCTPKTTLEYNSKRPRMSSIPAPSVCVFLYSRGPDSASAKPRSSSTR